LTDPYELLDSPWSRRHFPGYADQLRQLGVFDGLDDHDAMQVAGMIMCDQERPHWCGWGFDPRDPREVWPSLQQRAANVGTGCDVRQWHDRGLASKALGIAARCAREGA
jgi:hypothetical protein